MQNLRESQPQNICAFPPTPRKSLGAIISFLGILREWKVLIQLVTESPYERPMLHPASDMFCFGPHTLNQHFILRLC